MLEPLRIGGDRPLTLEDVARVARGGIAVALAPEARVRMERSRAVVDRIVAGGQGAPSVYGINTGFGALARVRIEADKVRELQRNLVRSHSVGLGAPYPTDVVRAIVLLRAQTLALGHSGVRPLLVDGLLAMLARGVHPIVPSRGSVGASGDLAPLAHVALALIGEGEAQVGGARLPTAEALSRAGLTPLALEAKEGLSLINGTQAMTADGALAVLDAEALARTADIAGAMTLEAVMGSARAFDPRIHALRPHPGQAASARLLARLCAGSGIARAHADCPKVQDPYSLRCMPQVHGATRDGLAFAHAVLEREIASVTDNPLVFAEADEILSGGNFHGQPVAMALDLAAIATAELGSISERRVEQLVNPDFSTGLPPFLAPSEEGLHSGFMIAQVTAAALVAESKILCHPASVDSIPSSAGREDHVSMGAHAARKLAQVVENVRLVLAIELCAAAQGLDLRRPLVPGRGVAAAYAAVRACVTPLVADRPLSGDIEAAARAIADGAVLAAVEREIGKLD
ncbi:MAG: histidine ammonia-lyase [Myxococcota bacterium]